MMLGLVMVVKNEAHGIAATLLSIKPYIDSWTILDTGSTDGTQAIVKDTLEGVAGQIHEEPFIDFATTYNRALELHGDLTKFVLHLLGDEVVTGGQKIRDFCAGNPKGDAFFVPMRQGGVHYKLPRLSRAGSGWRYVGRTHEAFSKPGADADGTVEDVLITRGTAPDEADRKRRRWEADRDILEDDLRLDPNNSRATFYLAQTYELLGSCARAELLYQRRAKMGGFFEEIYESKFRTAGCMDARGLPWSEIQQVYLDAHAIDPRRAEPLYQIARHWHKADDHALTYMFASRAAALHRPDTSMFVDAETYEWRAADLTAIAAFYLSARLRDPGVREVGRRAADQAVAARPFDERLRSNRAFYARTAVETFPSFRHQKLTFAPEPPFAALNPSVWHDGHRWRCIIRTSNYRLINGHYVTPGGEPIQTRNYMAELNQELAVERVTEMADRDTHPRGSFPVHGFEDCRLFSCNGHLFCTATVCDLNDHGMREIALLTIDDDYSISNAQVLRGPWTANHQKNWMPLVSSDGPHFIYSTKPEVVLPFNGGVVDASQTSTLRPGRLRGSSQAVRLPDGRGWLFLVHEVVLGSGSSRTYLHRFVQMSDDFKVERMSDLFSFLKRGIEFCAGLGYDGRRLVASFSVDDCGAWLGTLDLGEVLSSLRHDFVA